MRGQSNGGHTNISTGSGLLNQGTLRIESTDATFKSNVNGPLTNDTTGIINVNSGAGGQRVFSGNWTNNGTMNLNVTPSFSGTWTNNAAINIAAGQKLVNTNGTAKLVQAAGTIAGAGSIEFTGATLEHSGGTINVPVLMLSSTLNLTGTDSGIYTLSGTPTLTGTIAPAQTVWVRGQSNGGHTNVTIPSNVTNNGTLRMES